MPYSVDEKHSPSEFYYPGETNCPDATFQGEDNAEQNSNKNSQENVFFGLFYKSVQIAIEQSHIINPLLTSFARSVRESIAFRFYCTDLAPSSLGLYEKHQAILSRTDRANEVNKPLISREGRYKNSTKEVTLSF